MNLNQKLTEDMKAAMKSGDSQTLLTVKLLISAIHNKEIEKRTKLSKQVTEARELEEKSAPKELSGEEVRIIVKAKIIETGASSTKDFGKVMGRVTQETKGRADGVLVKKIVEEELSQL